MQLIADLDFSEAASHAHGRIAGNELLACDGKGTPLLAPAPGCSSLPTRLLVIPARETRAEYPTPNPRLDVAVSGCGSRSFRLGGREHRLSTRPGMVELYEGEATFERICWSGTAGMRVSVEFPAELTARLMHDDGRPVCFSSQFELFDAKLSGLAGALAQHTLDGHPHGSLYSEGLSLSLIALVLADHGRRPAVAGSNSRRLSARQVRRVQDYIEDNLGDDLRIEQIAREMEMSPHAFARRFRLTFDQSPHQYVLQRRIDRAERMLRQGYRGPITPLALSLGFSTHAHFTAAFKKLRGVPPSAAKV